MPSIKQALDTPETRVDVHLLLTYRRQERDESGVCRKSCENVSYASLFSNRWNETYQGRNERVGYTS